MRVLLLGLLVRIDPVRGAGRSDPPTHPSTHNPTHTAYPTASHTPFTHITERLTAAPPRGAPAAWRGTVPKSAPGPRPSLYLIPSYPLPSSLVGRPDHAAAAASSSCCCPLRLARRRLCVYVCDVSVGGWGPSCLGWRRPGGGDGWIDRFAARRFESNRLEWNRSIDGPSGRITMPNTSPTPLSNSQDAPLAGFGDGERASEPDAAERRPWPGQWTDESPRGVYATGVWGGV